MGRLERAVSYPERDPAFRFAVLYIDLDGFKAVNDILGHGIGDNLLVTVARQLERRVRGSDTVARLGGGEFVILFEHLAHIGAPAQLAERVLRDLTISLNVAGREVGVAASIGIVLSGRHLHARDLLDAADKAMYQAKAAGRARYHVFDD
ncbi:MAG: diguanylate cyclase/phosphodiesterase (GGDEF & EAL domains) with PAS/PAC sensor(s) [uncultured Truepera sp.]|uniref:Diguanylate cyclase/phosphodiesterase (GGDEF & EAL domains) with PAS/PAC sensor(S) n=1 Tax=uncultured Truepera sp. TaxID=543023 RepID=A0A6J4VYT6_9DEIN|nr:MAG: diguanylate cyclase/phosphodiesterase (GGDEF & EAL domains) with PAS/PAC sensor(s) [uncultured Truepera sp.]